MRLFSKFALIVFTLAPGCGGSSGGTGPDADVSDVDGSANGIDADLNGADAGAIPPGFIELVSRDWVLAPGTEAYRCTRVTVDQDMFVTAFRSLSPVGTHHTVLSVNKNSSLPDGDYDCNAGDIAHSMLFASGVGTDDLALPQGVAIPLEAGDQLDLNLHLYNVSDAQLSGTSGTLGRLIAAGDVVELAEVVFGGAYGIFLPSQPGVSQTVTGGCTFQRDATVIALWPHMHQLGRHIRVEHNGNTLLDNAFDFSEQLNYLIDPVQVKANERIAIDCTYINGTGSTVTFGDSSEKEMCFVGIYRYPATGAGVFDCVEF